MKNARKTSIVVLALHMTLLIFATVFYATSMIGFTKQQYNNRLRETGEQIGNQIKEQFTTSLEYVSGMAEVFSKYEDIHCDEAIDLLVEVSEKSSFVRMWLTKANGEAMSSELIESDATGKPYLAEVLKGNGGISDVQTSNVNNKRNIVVYWPTFYNGEVTGAVIGIYELESLEEILDIDCFNGKGYAYVYNDKGEVLVTTEDFIEETVLKEKYSAIYDIGYHDWKLRISFPEGVIKEEILRTVISTMAICLVYIAVVSFLLIENYRFKNQKLKKEAMTDMLTNLINRGAIEHLINKKLQTDVSKGAFILFDLDGFKLVNDTYGHLVGDAVLIQVARIARELFEEIGYVGRLGGDEFVIFAYNYEGDETLRSQIQKLVDNIANSHYLETADITMAISVGAVLDIDKNDTFDNLYKKADDLMYQSKKQGGKQVIFNK